MRVLHRSYYQLLHQSLGCVLSSDIIPSNQRSIVQDLAADGFDEGEVKVTDFVKDEVGAAREQGEGSDLEWTLVLGGIVAEGSLCGFC